ncbi:MAG TPA: NAD(P)-binding domain-containing protein, partial [Dongiaceae bacterium]
MTSATHSTDVAIVGAGPVGLFAVFECGMLKMRCHVVDALDSTGGQCAALYPEKPIYDIPGYPRIEAADLIRKLEEQIAPFHPVFHLNQQVNRLAKSDGGWLLETSQGTRIEAKAVIIAAGVGAFGPNRPPLPGIEAYEGKSVFYYVKQREDFRGKRVVIAGGGDSALDWTIGLADVAERVMVVHRRYKFRCAPDSAAKLKALSQSGQVERLTPVGAGWLVETAGGTRVAARAVIIAAGVGAFGPNRPPLERLGEFEGKSVFYLVKRKEDMRGKRVVIAGGGDSALDWTLALAGIAEKLYVIHRRPKFRGAPESVA